MVSPRHDEIGHALLEAAEHGDFRAARAHLTRIEPAASHHWTLAFRCMEAVAAPPRAPASKHVDEISELASLATPPAGTTGASARMAMATAAAVLARRAFLAFDPEAARALATRSTRWTPPDDDPAAPRAACARAWLEIGSGRLAGLSAFAAPWASRARELGCDAVALELDSLSAWSTLCTGDRGHGTDAIRAVCSAVRLGRLPQVEYLAHFVLAKARRAAARGYLSIRILAGLAKVLPGAWSRWLAWERGMCGVTDEEGATLHAATAAVPELIAAARVGDRVAFERARSALATELAGTGDPAHEASLLALLLDPALDADASEAAAWAAGTEPYSPRGLHSACPVPWVADGEASRARATTARQWPPVVWVVMAPDRRPRRIVWPGLGFVGPHGDALHQVQLHPKQGRLDTATSVLGLAGERGLRDETFFSAVYGFTFKRSMHQGALDVLVHRLRQRHLEVAEIRHGDGRVALTPRTTLVAPDPRCAPVVSEHVLRWMAERRHASAKEAADALGIPLRTVQGELKRLADDGSCTVERRGRRIAYSVEDTTFSEPTTSW